MIQLTYLLLAIAQASPEQCRDALKNEIVTLADLLTRNSNDIGPVLRFYYSGKDINDLGHYDSCVKRSDSRYLLYTSLLFNQIPISLGLCVPKACDASSFTAVVGGDSGMLSIKEPHTKSIGTGGVITLVLLGVLVLLVVVGTALKKSGSVLKCFCLWRNWEDLMGEPVKDSSRILNGTHRPSEIGI